MVSASCRRFCSASQSCSHTPQQPCQRSSITRCLANPTTLCMMRFGTALHGQVANCIHVSIQHKLQAPTVTSIHSNHILHACQHVSVPCMIITAVKPCVGSGNLLCRKKLHVCALTHPFQLPSALVVSSVVHELAAVTVRAEAGFLVVLADVRLVVKPATGQVR